MVRKLLSSLALSLMLIGAAYAQKAPNHYFADPAKYKHRLVQSGSFDYKRIYKYDDKNRLVEQLDQYNDDSFVRTTYEFNDAGYMIKATKDEGGDPTIVLEYKRDADGYVTSWHYSSKIEGLDVEALTENRRMTFTYDDAKRLSSAEFEVLDPDTENWVAARQVTFTYNDKSLLSTIEQRLSDNSLYMKESIFYSDKGMIDSVLTEKPEGTVKKSIPYQYDESGENAIRSGREGFYRYYEYKDKSMLLSETFIPHSNIEILPYYGLNEAGQAYVGLMLPEHCAKYAVSLYRSNSWSVPLVYEGTNATATDKVSATVLAVYPNPASSVATISVPQSKVGATAYIYDMTGKVVDTFKVTSSTMEYSVEHLANGQYLLKIDGSVIRLFVRH